jgi:hypothetical protein
VPQTGGAKATGTGGRAPDEAPGENVLTFMHGIVDAERVLVCFVAGRGADARVLAEPPSQLGYGESLVRRSLEGASFATDDIEPVVIAGELELVADLDCEAALKLAHAEQDATPTEPEGAGGSGGAGAAGASNTDPPAAGAGGEGGEGGNGPPLPKPPRLRVGELPIVPRGSLNAGRSYLLVGNGCIGGPAFSDKHDKEACGSAYSPTSPTLSAVLVALSRRTEIGKLGLQTANASVATGAVDLTASRLLSTDFQPIVADVELGAIVPVISQLSVTSEGYGANSPFWEVEAQNNGTSLFAERWSEITARGGLESLEDGLSYTLVVLGPDASSERTGFWNPRALSVVKNDPFRTQ